jgi:hypothetical protein
MIHRLAARIADALLLHGARVRNDTYVKCVVSPLLRLAERIEAATS